MSSAGVPAPENLSESSQAIWGDVVADYEMSSVELARLKLGLEALDRAQEARRVLDRDGLMVVDRYGAPKLHPLTVVEKDARNAAATILRGLGLEAVVAVPAPRRP